jgi:hypothetical protein
MKTTIPTQAEYEAREARDLARKLAEIDAAPLSERKEAKAEYASALTDPELIQERCEWLLNGSYGFGACKAAARIQAQQRGNKAAALGLLVAALDWNCPARFAAAAYRELTSKQKKAIDKAIAKALKTQAATTA